MTKVQSAEEILNEFNNRHKLSDFISKYVQLTPRGNSHIGKCPFHNEKTPSFTITDDKGLFYCFGCKEGGNVINFISKYKNLTFRESLKFLASYLGIEILYNKNGKTNTFKRFYEILTICNNFFQENLYKDKFSYNYIYERIKNIEVLKEFNVGFCPDDIILRKYLLSKKFSESEINGSGLFIKNKKNEYFGRFSRRITFPIFNFSNQIVGFGARSIRESKIKYINSPESIVFKKSETLFGLKQNFDQIKKNEELILVEGYLDVISMYQKGIKNSVATLGTTLSEIQINKMWNFSSKPYVCFDGDLAGRKSVEAIALKVLKFLVPGKSLKFIFLPNNHDPDSFITQNSVHEFNVIKEDSLDLSMIIWLSIKNSIRDFTPENMALIDQKISQISQSIQNGTVSREYFKFLKNQKDKFYWENNKIRSYSTEKNKNSTIKKNLNDMIFLMFLLFEENLLEEFHEEISLLKLNHPTLEKFRLQIIEIHSISDKSDIKSNLDLFKNKDNKLYNELSSLRSTHIINLNDNEKKIFFKQLIRNLRLPVVENERESLKKEILMCKDKSILDKLIKKHDEINNEIRSIRNKLLE
ncbi:MAG: DNA primase [Rickettsiales bacterium]|nr:DNA primase [Rickettsiales bacterium]